ncbi:hypothetical protein BY996DRAFT_6494118 [Phakopsora pachyrhizi]|uniref:Uncharacterized protein n=1 Tax=Phakopsora pachyrhizi TaxID=170000 RepID=A0AAV0BF67_PHAPC|nr:hypothetical protein BY996DRAFT_6494118 [Phakopsora pachyrhizi]CAH7685571.1 hypothetical protein PPACK8108_LOCUS20122 [Phakopsora pachyrhizi]
MIFKLFKKGRAKLGWVWVRSGLGVGARGRLVLAGLGLAPPHQALGQFEQGEAGMVGMARGRLGWSWLVGRARGRVVWRASVWLGLAGLVLACL